MKSNKYAVWLVAILFAIMSSPSLWAGTIMQTQPFSGTPNYDEILTFNQYNGVEPLLSVKVKMEVMVSGGTLVVDNDGADPAVVLTNCASSAYTANGVLTVRVQLRTAIGQFFAGVFLSKPTKCLSSTRARSKSISTVYRPGFRPIGIQPYRSFAIKGEVCVSRNAVDKYSVLERKGMHTYFLRVICDVKHD